MKKDRIKKVKPETIEKEKGGACRTSKRAASPGSSVSKTEEERRRADVRPAWQEKQVSQARAAVEAENRGWWEGEQKPEKGCEADWLA